MIARRVVTVPATKPPVYRVLRGRGLAWKWMYHSRRQEVDRAEAKLRDIERDRVLQDDHDEFDFEDYVDLKRSELREMKAHLNRMYWASLLAPLINPILRLRWYLLHLMVVDDHWRQVAGPYDHWADGRVVHAQPNR